MFGIRPTSEHRVGIPADQDQAFDYVIIGRGDSERAHNLKGERTNSGSVGPVASWRDANGGGWFSYDLALTESGPAEIVITYWGSDQGDQVLNKIADPPKLQQGDRRGRRTLAEDLTASGASRWQTDLGESNKFSALSMVVCPNAIVAVIQQQQKRRA